MPSPTVPATCQPLIPYSKDRRGMPRSVALVYVARAALGRDARVLAPAGGGDRREQATRPHVHAGVAPLGQRRRLREGEQMAQGRVHVEGRDEPPAVGGELGWG